MDWTSASGTRVSVELKIPAVPFTAGSESFPVNVGSGSVALDSSEEESRLYSGQTSGVDSLEPF